MAGDNPSVSYVDSNLSTASAYVTNVTNAANASSWSSGGVEDQNWIQPSGRAPIIDADLALREIQQVMQDKSLTTRIKKRGNVKMRLVRFTVVDPDEILAREAPESSILTSGTRVTAGDDDLGLIMEIASGIDLVKHNLHRSKVTYDTEKGDTRTLRAIKLGQLDIVLEVLKSYDE